MSNQSLEYYDLIENIKQGIDPSFSLSKERTSTEEQKRCHSLNSDSKKDTNVEELINTARNAKSREPYSTSEPGAWLYDQYEFKCKLDDYVAYNFESINIDGINYSRDDLIKRWTHILTASVEPSEGELSLNCDDLWCDELWATT